MVREIDDAPEEAKEPSHPEHEQWVNDVAKALNIDLAAAQGDPHISGSVQMRDMAEPQADEEGDHRDLPQQDGIPPEFEREDSAPHHRNLQQRERRETPPDNSPIRVSAKPDGTMVIDAASVPSASNLAGCAVMMPEHSAIISEPPNMRWTSQASWAHQSLAGPPMRTTSSPLARRVSCKTILISKIPSLNAPTLTAMGPIIR